MNLWSRAPTARPMAVVVVVVVVVVVTWRVRHGRVRVEPRTRQR